MSIRRARRVVWIALLVAGAPLLSGCAGARRKPCTVRATITLAAPDDVNRICKSWQKLHGHDGALVKADRRVWGCADQRRMLVITRDNPDTLYHELTHLWDAHCR